jgi:hypothetical protein
MSEAFEEALESYQSLIIGEDVDAHAFWIDFSTGPDPTQIGHDALASMNAYRPECFVRRIACRGEGKVFVPSPKGTMPMCFATAKLPWRPPKPMMLKEGRAANLGAPRRPTRGGWSTILGRVRPGARPSPPSS